MAEKRRKKFWTKRRKERLGSILAVVLILAIGLLVFRLTDPQGFSRLTGGLFDGGTADGTEISGADSSFSVHMIDIGIGDAFLVQCDGHNMLIDAGENNAGDEVLDYLNRQGVRKLDAAVGTHAHSDHIGGMDTVLRKMPCDRFILSEVSKQATPTTKTFLDLLDVLEQKKIPVEKAHAGRSFMLGSARVEILGPVKIYDDLNNSSVVLRVVYGDTAFLFTGDMESPAEQDLIASGCSLRADVLKLGHHGSSTATSSRFLKKVGPEYGLISVNEGNKYGHPHAETMSKLKKAHVKTYLTRDSGHVVIRSDGKKLTVRTEKEI